MYLEQQTPGGHYSRTARAPARVAEITKALTLPCFVMSFGANEEIFGEEEAADFLYQVVSGSVRTTRTLNDGRRQIAAFHLVGDVFGLECSGVHRVTAEAIEASEIALVRRAVLQRAVDDDGLVAHQLWSLTSRELQRAEDHMVLLGRKTARERLGAFLVDLAARRPPSTAIDLPMSRSDIADHLGMTVETVSRTFSQLARERAIALPNSRHVILLNRAALANA
jgi:CRP/FNR family nitrogen fixation transcriptional regulator